MLKTLRTICFLLDNDEILFTETVYSSKYRRFTGVGGEVSSDKRIEHETVQYLYNDLRITVYPHDLQKMAILHRVSENENNEIIADETLYVYIVEKWQGDIKATPGRKPEWFTLDTIPYDLTLEYEKEWIHFILEGNKVLIEILEKRQKDKEDFELVNIAVRDLFS